jgi:pimeloyl-ACP methyl ester carboxylesterase
MLFLGLSTPAIADYEHSGDWLGTLTTPTGPLRLKVHASVADDGSMTGTLESLDQAPGQRIPMSEFHIDDTEMRFEIPALGATYQGQWDAEAGHYDGEFSQGVTLELDFARADTTSIVVIDGLDGSWTGQLDRETVQLDFNLNIETGEDGTQASLDSIAQGAYGIPIAGLEREGDTVRFQVPAANVTYEGQLDSDGSGLTGRWQRPGFDDAIVRFERQSMSVTQPNRPQTPVAPFPYREIEVRIANPEAEGVTLAGTLTVPPGDGPFPAAVLISGSGPQDRNETVWTHQPFAVLADHLSRHGIAVLRYDDRGHAESTGDFAGSTSMDFASDAQAVAEWLRAQPAIDPNAVGLIGHSEGGLIAPVVAARDEALAYIILLAGPGTDGQQIILDQSLASARVSGRSEADLERLHAIVLEITEAARTAPDEASARAALDTILSPDVLTFLGAMPDQKDLFIDQNVRAWHRAFLNHEPASYLADVDQPILALNGSLDLQVVPGPNLAGIETGLAHNDDVTLMELPGLNHMFQTAQTGTIPEYAQIEETFDPQALAIIEDWINTRFGGQAAR